MATAHMEKTPAKRWARASILNSLLLPITAALGFSVTFWVLTCTNFLLFHAVWISQVLASRDWRRFDLRAFFWSLVAFAVLGNLSMLVWGEQLLAVLPTYSD